MAASALNLVVSDEQRDFFVWVNPQTFLVQANVHATGQFSSADLINPDETLPFLRNDKFGGRVTPFLQSARAAQAFLGRGHKVMLIGPSDGFAEASSVDRSNLVSTSLGPTVSNISLEGISLDPLSGQFVAVKEKLPQ